jgi:UDPglucose 6-dehydrogenase/GDP-mannose 6-dehydrogenase
MKISIIGTGYVGLVSGACLAEKGHDVTCVDMDMDKVALINSAIPPIHEPGLGPLLEKSCGRNLRATRDLRHAVLDSDLSIIAVGTPFDGEEIDLEYIRTAARQIGAVLREKSTYHVVVVKSTVVPGTTSDVVLPILEEASGKTAGCGFGVGMNPEFLREGEAVRDFLYPDRIVLGGIDDRTLGIMAEIYRPFGGIEVMRTNTHTAEMIKYTANSLLAAMISFSNEIGNLCAVIPDVDVTEVMHGVHLDKRLSPVMQDGTRITPPFITYLEAGCGFGGSCFPKDVKALVAHGRKLGAGMDLLASVIRVNTAQPQRMIIMLDTHIADLSGVRITVLGVAFKPGTDDIRESPALPVMQALLDRGATVTAFDPVARGEAEKHFGIGVIRFTDSLDDAVAGSRAVLLMTRWPEFSRLPQLMSGMAEPPVLIDGRRLIPRSAVPCYEGIGVGSAR